MSAFISSRRKFNIMISLENGQLMSQASGQAKAPIFASSETKFFYKVVDAQIDFVKDDKGKVTCVDAASGGKGYAGAANR